MKRSRIILLISLSSIIILWSVIWNLIDGDSWISYMILLSIGFIQIFLILLVIYILYDKPIKSLEYTIKKFISWSLKEENIHLQKSGNPQLDYILLFFRKTIHTLKDIKSEFIHGKEIKSEVDLAKEIQGKLLWKKIPEVPNLEIVARSKPAGEIWGDSFDVIAQGDNYYIYVGDATGHGVGAGFIMMMVNALVHAYTKATQKGNHILALTNDIIKPRVKANLLMSLLLVRWNAKEKRLYMTGAGHEYLMVYKHKQQKCFKVQSGGVALGMTKNIHKLLQEKEVAFEENDVIILYSDGITEAINRKEKDGNESMYGETMLLRAIEEAPCIWEANIKTARSIFKNISISLSQFMGYKHVQLDDITLVTMQYVSAEYNKEEDCSPEMWEDFITEWNWN